MQVALPCLSFNNKSQQSCQLFNWLPSEGTFCAFSMHAKPSVFVTWTAQRSYSRLHLGRAGWCPKISSEAERKNLPLRTRDYYSYHLFSQLFGSAENSDHRQQIWGYTNCKEVSIRDEIFCIFARLGLLPAFSFLSRSDKIGWALKM